MNQNMGNRQHLPSGTILDGSYRIEKVIGSGGFGITYLAHDLRLLTTVAVKEYFPEQFGIRNPDQSVAPISQGQVKTFEWGRASFLREAQTLARFRHPSIVQVTRVFEANSTAYMVMAFEQGVSLEDWLRGLQRPPTQDELDLIVTPLLDALEMMHAQSFLHRDIAPDNIIIRKDSTPVLLDFGAARRAVAEQSRMLTGLVKQGYSPHEQYSADGRHQGPWTDFYALGATLYRSVTGSPPDEATLRVVEDHMTRATEAAHVAYRPGFLEAIDTCLKVKPSDRPQTVAQVREILLQRSVPSPAAPMAAPKTAAFTPGVNTGTKYVGTQRADVPGQRSQMAAWRWTGISVAAAAVLVSAVAGYFYLQRETRRQSEQAKMERLKAEETARQRLAALRADEERQRAAAERAAQDERERIAEEERRRALAEKAALEERQQQEVERRRATAEKAAQDERERIAEEQRWKEMARRDVVAELTPGSGVSVRDNLANGAPCPFCPEMVVVPAGRFAMGSPPNENKGLDYYEGPQFSVTIRRPFAVGKFEVTFEEWLACVTGGGCTNNPNPKDWGWGRGRRPVIDVSWDDAKEYVSWLSQKTGKTYRLLSEAEWEYAARAGTTTPYHWGKEIDCSRASYDGGENSSCSEKIGGKYRGTQPVGSYRANAFGLHDMHGNVQEWVEDCRGGMVYNKPNDGSAATWDCDARERARRGGSWRDFPSNVRSASRFSHGPHFPDRVGFRVARTLAR